MGHLNTISDYNILQNLKLEQIMMNFQKLDIDI